MPFSNPLVFYRQEGLLYTVVIILPNQYRPENNAIQDSIDTPNET
jgi:hypothetical protein